MRTVMGVEARPGIRIFSDQYQLAEAAAREFATAAARAACGGVNFTVALSGGSTPALFFRELARRDIDWSLVHCYWGDERCVPPNHAESNYLMTREELLDRVDIPASNVHRIRGEDDPDEEISRYAAEISRTVVSGSNGLPVFDWIFLGLGEDGHTASVFPGAILHPEPSGLCAVARHPGSGRLRVTLTLPAINNAARITFLIAGSGKAEVVGKILGQKESFLDYPAALVWPLQGRLEWFLDQEAAKELPIAD